MKDQEWGPLAGIAKAAGLRAEIEFWQPVRTMNNFTFAYCPPQQIPLFVKIARSSEQAPYFATDVLLSSHLADLGLATPKALASGSEPLPWSVWPWLSFAEQEPALADAGRLLAQTHQLLAEHQSPLAYQASDSKLHLVLRQTLPKRLQELQGSDYWCSRDLAPLLESYQQLAALGYRPNNDRQLLHGDPTIGRWGNLRTDLWGHSLIFDFEHASFGEREWDYATVLLYCWYCRLGGREHWQAFSQGLGGDPWSQELHFALRLKLLTLASFSFWVCQREKVAKSDPRYQEALKRSSSLEQHPRPQKRPQDLWDVH